MPLSINFCSKSPLYGDDQILVLLRPEPGERLRRSEFMELFREGRAAN